MYRTSVAWYKRWVLRGDFLVDVNQIIGGGGGGGGEVHITPPSAPMVPMSLDKG